MQGEIWLVPFPFSESEAITFKKRPVLVIAPLDGDEGDSQPILTAMITSNQRRLLRPKAFDVPVAADPLTGLKLPGVVRAGRIWTAERRDLKLRLGSVDQPTIERVRELIVNGYGLA